ncbi:hypothetical protein GUJ93_ZPchr0007g4322 [Zizania palustris]|uniref:Uncharacterized protein n=1 Tax=Zizania palustris TaxID=103762 RepID=A0A8J5TIT4_ZIZPA|nr:hypothetical protein GUJ93_ZPchr0007g4322 [Zizania palustris]
MCISCSDNSEAGGAGVPSCPSDHRDVRLFLAVAMDLEEPEAILRVVAVKQAGDEDSRPADSQPRAARTLSCRETARR